MDNGIFRKKSIDKMQAPENLKDYVKVIHPSLWIVFIAAFLLLTGAFVWGSVGKIEDKISVTVVVENGTASCEYNNSAEEGMKAEINGNEGYVSSVTPSQITFSFGKTIPDGVYAGFIVIDEISPISFVFN